MKSKFKVITPFMALFASIQMSMAQPELLNQSANVGDPVHKGCIVVDKAMQTWVLSGGGKNIWADDDEFFYQHTEMTGDFILRAQVKFIGEGTDPHRKTGLMFRQSLDANAPFVSATLHGDGLTSLQFRRKPGGITEELRSEDTHFDVVQLERKGNVYTMSVAKFGRPFTTVVLDTLHEGEGLKEGYLAGIFVCAHNEEVIEKVEVSNIRLIKPAWEGLVPYTDYLGSNLEILDIATGHRSIIYTADNSIQAPNWFCDGKKLLYNSDGLLYNFDLATNTPEVLNTGVAKTNNNDHVLSFDCKMLAISDHTEHPDGQSQIYILPATGGEPKLITKDAPSYLHGWSVDKKDLVFTGGRNNKYDIYKISVKDRKEIQLTDTKGLDDGPEFSPDGKYIYFNSDRTGTMQIWRMKTDGSEPTQLTFDEYNDWFPHISLDGKWMVFVSFMPDIPSAEHPFYKHVYIRMMPVEGGEPKVLAYVYGGQGTMNVPSWSPDGKKVAFVSNTAPLK